MGLSTWADRASSCNITAESCTAAMTARIRHDDELSVFVGNFALASSLCNQGRTWLIGETKRWREISGDGGGRVLDQDGEGIRVARCGGHSLGPNVQKLQK